MSRVARPRATSVVLSSMLLVTAMSACADDGARPSGADDTAVVLAGLDHTLLGKGGRRGSLHADTAVFGDQLGTVVLVRPVLTIDTTATAPLPLEIAADSGTLDVATEIVRLVRLRRVNGAPPTLLSADTVAYDPAGDSLWAVPGGRVR